MDLKDYITIEDFAKMAKVSHQAIYDLILKKRLPATDILGKKVIDITDETIKAYLINNKGDS